MVTHTLLSFSLMNRAPSARSSVASLHPTAMQELLAFPESNEVSLGSTPRGSSPDSLFYAFDSSSTSLFSSASASADRSSSSLASEFHDREPHSRQNAVGGEEVSNVRASDPDLRRFKRVLKKGLKMSTKEGQKEVVSRAHALVEEGDLNAVAGEARRSSFSRADKESHKRRSDLLPKVSDHYSPSLLDLNNNATAYSPRLGVIKNSSNANQCSDAFPSPGTHNYRQPSSELQKGGSSERVPLPQIGNRRQLGNAHFSLNNGRVLPSKWEDAERWIVSPITTDIGSQQIVPPPQRRPKAKSGPLGPSGVAYYSSYSPDVHMFDVMQPSNLLTGTPISAGIMVGGSLPTGFDSNLWWPSDAENNIARSVSLHGYTAQSLNQFPFPHSPRIDEKFEGVKDASIDVSRAVTRRNMATQMSPEGSPCSSPRRRYPTCSALSIVEMRNSPPPGLGMRDVEVDEKVKMTRWSKKNNSCLTKKVDDWTKNAAEVHSKAREDSDAAKRLSKVRREEARIAAWENLQKAIAEGAIRKLEMQLEKKRLASVEKIMNKLRLAEEKGQVMRRAALANQAQQVSSSSDGTITVHIARTIRSFGGCFTSHAPLMHINVGHNIEIQSSQGLRYLEPQATLSKEKNQSF